MNEFVKIEYDKCLDLLRYYDGRQLALMQFVVVLSGAVPSVIFGVYGISKTLSSEFWAFVAIISGFTTAGLLTVFFAMLQNRLYFVFPARQVNALRKVMLEENKASFTNNQMYIDSSFSAFKWMSVHSFIILFTAIQIGMMFGISFFAAQMHYQLEELRYAVLSGIVMALILFGFSGWYLRTKGQISADKAVHGKD